MTRFRIEPVSSHMWVDARTDLHPVHGEATGIDGWIEAALANGGLDLSDPPKARVELNVGSIRWGNALFNNELRRRIQARRYPTIVGELTEAREAGPGRYALRGDLSFRGVTRPVDGEVEVRIPGEDAIEVEGEQTFDIRDFNMDPPRMLMLKAYPDVKVRIHLVGKLEG